jgi:ubiquinone/menaquinone biosynthesis C-methylase UbiE
VGTPAEFSGSIPKLYDTYLGSFLFEPYAVDLAARLPSGDDLRVLEVACGTGIVTRRLRETLPASATLVATDLNEAMVAYAREAVAAPAIDWRQADAQALPFEDGSFDVLVCQFGFMFLPDKVQGFREARRVLAEGGLLLANVWESTETNPYVHAIQTTLARIFRADPPRFLETPYGYYDTSRLMSDMKGAGWEEVRLESVSLQGASRSAQDVATGFVCGTPLSHELAERGVDPDEIARELALALIPVGGDRPFTSSLAATVITARR